MTKVRDGAIRAVLILEDEHVLWSHISVDDALAVRVLKPPSNILDDEEQSWPELSML